MKEILEDYWVIKVDDNRFYSMWLDDKCLAFYNYECCPEFPTKEDANKTLKKVKQVYPNAKVCHLVVSLDDGE